jgi:ABC-2 type transport system ATP-binding protein
VSSHILPELGEMCTSVGIVDRGRLLRSGPIDEIERSLRATAVLQIDVLGDDEAVAAADAALRADERVGDVLRIDGAPPGATRLELPFDGDPEQQAELLRRLVEAGHRLTGFRQATSDLEEIFMKVTGQADPAEAAA